MAYGGDYNPEQWPEEIWSEDMQLLNLAKIDIVTLNVFSWATLQPNETSYYFTKLDKIMELVKRNNLKVCLATSTGAHPAWMAKKYPDILRVDFEGRKRKFGGRHNSCPNSPTYHKYCVALVNKLANRYKDYDNIVAWHVSNEFGGECYCENCEKEFQVWLQDKYHTIDKLNTAWNTSFWGHTFYEWDEIVLPDSRSEHFEQDRTMFQGISLDYRRFMSDSLLRCYIEEHNAIKKIIPSAVITTNLMGFYKPLNYFEWAKHMDFVSWDNYPANDDSYAKIAMSHDLMRGIKQGEPFALMMDWENWWAIEYSAGPSCDLKYLKEFGRYYEALRNMNYNVDIISSEDDLLQYKIVIAPVLYMVKGKDDERIREFVKEGGIFLTTFFSGIVEENDLVTLGGYPGKLRDILGIWVEEEDALAKEQKNGFSYKGKEYPAMLLCDLIHLEGAVQIDDYGYAEDFYKELPVLTMNHYGKGRSYYVATASDEDFYREFLQDLCTSANVHPVIVTPDGVEATSRENENERMIFLMNHNQEDALIDLPFKAFDVITNQTFEAGQICLKRREVMILTTIPSDGIPQGFDSYVS
ncbi:beta-galactosidase [Anaerosporobacter sp.]